MVRGVEDHLVTDLRVATGDLADDVGGLDVADVVVEQERGVDAEGHRLEVARARRRHQLVELLAGELDEAARGVLGEPAADLDARLPLGRQLELLAAPGGLHHLEGVAGGGRGVDDDRRRRALARRALVLVGPAAVVEAAVAGEQVVVPVRVVVEHEQDLALEVHALEVVPLELGRLDAVTDEDHLGILDGGLALGDAGGGYELLAALEGDALAGAVAEGPGGRRVRVDADHLEVLHPAAAGSRRLEADLLHLLHEVLAGLGIRLGARAAPLEGVAAELGDGLAQHLGSDRLPGLVGLAHEGTVGRGGRRGDCRVRRRLGFAGPLAAEGADGQHQDARESASRARRKLGHRCRSSMVSEAGGA